MDKQSLEIGNRMVKEIERLEERLKDLQVLRDTKIGVELNLFPSDRTINQFWESDGKVVTIVTDMLIHETSTKLMKLRQEFERL